MKKVISIISIIAGGLALLSAAVPAIMEKILGAQVARTIGVIGGADGPTSVMVVGVLGAGSITAEIILGVLLIAAGIWGLRGRKK